MTLTHTYVRAHASNDRKKETKNDVKIEIREQSSGSKCPNQRVKHRLETKLIGQTNEKKKMKMWKSNRNTRTRLHTNDNKWRKMPKNMMMEPLDVPLLLMFRSRQNILRRITKLTILPFHAFVSRSLSPKVLRRTSQKRKKHVILLIHNSSRTQCTT